MTSRNATIWKSKGSMYYRAEFGEVEVSNGDTITFTGFDSSQALLNVYLMKKSNGLEMTGNIALNVYTITGAGTNVDCVYLVYGIKA